MPKTVKSIFLWTFWSSYKLLQFTCNKIQGWQHSAQPDMPGHHQHQGRERNLQDKFCSEEIPVNRFLCSCWPSTHQTFVCQIDTSASSKHYIYTEQKFSLNSKGIPFKTWRTGPTWAPSGGWVYPCGVWCKGGKQMKGSFLEVLRTGYLQLNNPVPPKFTVGIRFWSRIKGSKSWNGEQTWFDWLMCICKSRCCTIIVFKYLLFPPRIYQVWYCSPGNVNLVCFDPRRRHVSKGSST